MEQNNTHNEHINVARTMGLARWVQFAFFTFAGLLTWFVYHVTEEVWNRYQEPDTSIISAVAVLLGFVSTFLLYRNENVRTTAYEVAGELDKVVWPTRKDTWSNTLVVIISSVVAALVLYSFDVFWAAIIRYIY